MPTTLLDVLAAQLKLTWIHADLTEVEQPTALFLSPRDELERLSDVARSGRIVDVQAQLFARRGR